MKLTAFWNGKYDLVPLCIQMKFHIYQLKVTNSISRGDYFRTDYSHLGILCALLPSVPVLALLATASKKDRQVIKDTLHMINPLEVVGTLNRPNIFYEKVFRNGPDVESYEEILLPIATNLLVQKIEYPLTIVYLSLRWCGFAYRLFERIKALSNIFLLVQIQSLRIDCSHNSILLKLLP